VKCPKCGVELIVPSPNDEPTPPEEPDPDAFRLEDIGLRLEPEPLVKPPAAPPPPPEPVGPDPIAYLAQVAATGEVPEAEAREGPPTGEGDTPAESGDATELIKPREEPLVSRKRGRRPSDLLEPTVRARDVVIPRSAAVAWAMFGLLALAFAFTSGLFVGHTLWK
jgi:hypothetical protein